MIRWIAEYFGQIVIVVLVLLWAIALDVASHYCRRLHLSSWLVDGIDQTAQYFFYCDQFMICAMATIGAGAAVVEYAMKVWENHFG